MSRTIKNIIGMSSAAAMVVFGLLSNVHPLHYIVYVIAYTTVALCILEITAIIIRGQRPYLLSAFGVSASVAYVMIGRDWRFDSDWIAARLMQDAKQASRSLL